MSNKRILAITFISFAILIALFLRRTRTGSGGEVVNLPDQTGVVMQSESPPSSPPQFNTAKRRTSRSQTNAPSAPVKKLGQAELIDDYMAHANVPIMFYGKVVDQNEAPVSGAKIQFICRQYVWGAPGIPEEKNQRMDRITDANGMFELSGASGSSLAIEEITKAGYELSPRSIRFYKYREAGFQASASNPVIFRMWKKQGADRLVKQDKDTRIPYNGTPVSFDLIEGKKIDGTGGDIRVSLLRSPLEHKLGSKEKYDWTATVEVVNGGIIEARDEFLNQAPEGGYVPAGQIKMLATDENWTPDFIISFYFKSRGNFGRVTLEFRTGSDKATTGFSYHSLINPTGSRNLEYDSRQITSTDAHFPPE